MKTLGRPMKLESVRSELLMEITAKTMERTEGCTVDQLRQIIAEIREISIQLQTTKRHKPRLADTNVHLRMLLVNPGRLN